MLEPVNPAPLVLASGVDDRSIKKLEYTRAERHIHTPLVFLYTETGPEDYLHVTPNTAVLTFGDKTFDSHSPYYNHATHFAKVFASNANEMVIKRIIPDDIRHKANLRLWVELMDVEMDDYERNSDGTLKVDSHGDYIKKGTGKINGLEVKFGYEEIDPSMSHTDDIGQAAVNGTSPGSLTGGTSASTRYPIMDLEVNHLGAKGNHYGISISAPTTRSRSPLRTEIFEQDKCYPFRLQLMYRMNPNVSPKEVLNNYGIGASDFVLKRGLIDSAFSKERFIEDIILHDYQVLTPDEGQPVQYGPFGRVYVYDETIRKVLSRIAKAEEGVIGSISGIHHDLAGINTDESSDDIYKVNLFGLQTTQGIPYYGVRFSPVTTGGLRLNEYTTLYAQGGSDGTMTNELFDLKVRQLLEDFDNLNNPVQDIVMHPWSAFWDSGFSMDTKSIMGKFISTRKNTCLYLTTHVDGEKPLTADLESSRGTAIREKVIMYSESEVFSTPTCRATIIMRSGDPISGSYRKRCPVSLDFANAISMMAGAPKFKPSKRIDLTPNNQLTLLTNINAPWVPDRVRNLDWASGLMWPERFSQRRYFFPSTHTVYKDDTSILASVVNAMIVAECETVGYYAHKQVTGGILTQHELREAVLSNVKKNLVDKFASYCIIEPSVVFTVGDKSRGYSWTLIIKVYGKMMRTVQRQIVQTYDMDNLPDNNKGFVA